MNEMEPEEAKMDSFLRKSMAGPAPALSKDFDQCVMRRVGARSLDRYGQVLLCGYGLVSGIVSAVIMQEQGLGWEFSVAINLGTIGLLGIGWSIWRATQRAAQPSRAE